jgi:hypothetical protein
MFVCELSIPGTRIDDPDHAWAFATLTTLRILYTTLDDISLSLIMFQVAMASRIHHFSEQGMADRAREQQIERELLAASDLNQMNWKRRTEISDTARLAAKRERWANKLPQSYQDRLPFLYARSFVVALDRLHKLFEILAREIKAPTGLRDVITAF